MEGVAHNAKFAKKVGIAPSVGKEFVKADEKEGKFADGGATTIPGITFKKLSLNDVANNVKSALPPKNPVTPKKDITQEQRTTLADTINNQDARGVVGEEDYNKGGIVPRQKFDNGGGVDQYHGSGFFASSGPGRTDILDRAVPPGGYVIPADVVAGLGEGNSLAGSAVIDKMMKTGPYGTQLPRAHGRGDFPHLPPPARISPSQNENPQFAKGGATKETVPVKTAGGEHFINPQDIINKFGSLKRGHQILDQFVINERKKHIKTLQKLPGPKK